MNIFFKEFTFSTRKRQELVDITRNITSFLNECKIESGICVVSSPHSTTSIIVNENEEGLVQDILNMIKEIFPKGSGWLHDRIDDNSDAHLASVFLGHSKVFPVKNGRVKRGIWQNIFLLELDGPRIRQITCEVIGE